MSPKLRVVITRILVSSLLLVFCDVVASPATPPPDDLPNQWAPSLKFMPAKSIRFGHLIISFEKTTLASVIRNVGQGTFSHQGDAGGSVYWVCYIRQHRAANTIIWIQSSGEMGGAKHAITQVTARIEPKRNNINGCQKLPRNFGRISLNDQIWVGSATNRAIQLFGTPSVQKSDWQLFEYQGKTGKGCTPGGFDITNWVSINVKHNMITAIDAGQITSC